MTSVRLELICHGDDEEALIGAMRAVDVDAPIDALHLDVHPLDLSYGSIRERITGRSPRLLLRVLADEDACNAVLKQLADVHLQHPVRWTQSRIDDSGEIS